MLGTFGDGWNNQTKYQLYIYTIYRYTQLNFGTFECYIDNSHINAPRIYHSKMKVQTCFIIILIYILKSWNIQAWINQNFTCVVMKWRWYEGLAFKSKSIFNASDTQSVFFSALSPNHHGNSFLWKYLHYVLITIICIPFLGMEFVQVDKLYPLTNRHTGQQNLLHVELPCHIQH